MLGKTRKNFKGIQKIEFMVHDLHLIYPTIDINECLTQRDICGAGRCTNTEGSYFCTCDPGYELTEDRSRCIG